MSDLSAKLGFELLRQLRTGSFLDTKPSLVSTVRKFLDDHPHPTDEELQIALDELRSALDAYIGWALTSKKATAAALEQVRIMLSDSTVADRKVDRPSTPLNEHERSVLRIVPVIDPDDEYKHDDLKKRGSISPGPSRGTDPAEGPDQGGSARGVG